MRTRRYFAGLTILDVIPIALLSFVSPAFGESGWAIEFLVGIPLSFPSSLVIHQAGEPDLRHQPRFQSRPFDRPLYYTVRIGKWDGPDGWELEMNHDKLYLSNPTTEIEQFSISHGFNRITLNRSMERTLQWLASMASWERDTAGDLTPRSLRSIVIALPRMEPNLLFRFPLS